jgi:hypothetical protein
MDPPPPPVPAVQAVPAFYQNPGEYIAAGADYADWGLEREIKN